MNKNILMIKLFLGTTFSIFLLFFTWKISYSSHCFSLILPIIMLIIIGYGQIELKMEERSCTKKCYFKDGTFFAKILSSRFFVTIFYILVSIAMTISTFMVAIDFPTFLWLYFVIHILLSLFLFRYLNYKFKNIFQQQYQSLFAREWTIRLMAVILMVVFIYISLNEYTPAYLTNSLQQTVNYARDSIFSNCDIINITLKYGKTIDSTFWWAVSESTAQIHNTLIKTGIWFVFLFFNSLALLGVNRLIIQIIYMLNNIFNNKRLESNERK